MGRVGHIMTHQILSRESMAVDGLGDRGSVRRAACSSRVLTYDFRINVDLVIPHRLGYVIGRAKWVALS